MSALTITYADRVAVDRFLAENIDLRPVIKGTQLFAYQVFGNDAVDIVLDVDHDYCTEKPYLTFSIRTRLAPSPALDRLHRLDAQWIPKFHAVTGDRMLVTLGHVR